MSLSVVEKPQISVSNTVVSLIKRTQYTIEADVPRANWFQRVVCVILDWFAAFVFVFLASLIIDLIFGGERLNAWVGKTFHDAHPVWGPSVLFIGFAFYRPIAQALFHQTFGERLLRIYVANVQRTQLNLGQVIKRHACPTIWWLSVTFQFHFPPIVAIGIIGLLLWTGGSLRAFKSDRRTLLDLFSGSYVYKKPRK